MNWPTAALKLLSMLTTVFFGVLALITPYKNAAGELTKAGKIAIAGVILSGAVSILLYAIETQASMVSSKKAEERDEVNNQRMMLPLGSMSVRIVMNVPAAQFAPFRDRLVRENTSWKQPYAMPVTLSQLPRYTNEEKAAVEFFGQIAVVVSASPDSQAASQPRRPEFDKLLLFSLPRPEQEAAAAAVNGNRSNGGGAIQLFYDHKRDFIILDAKSQYFDDFDTAGKFLSFRDFAEKKLILAFNLTPNVVCSVSFVEIESRAGRRRIFLDDFKEIPAGSRTYVGKIGSEAFRD